MLTDFRLLATKLFVPPARSELVARSRLIDRLQKGIEGRLTLISAPAGFGKTTLINAWRVKLEQPVVWLSLDERDNDLARFLAYFVASLQKVDKNIGLGVQKALQLSELPSVESLMTALINDIIAARPGSFVQVLDDYHVIQEQNVHEAMTFLLEKQPPRMHLIIATREDPPLPFSRLEAQGQASILRSRELHFNADETARFLNDLMKLGLSAEDIGGLHTKTEGWIAGLHLAALSLEGRLDKHHFVEVFTGMHGSVIDYLAEEVISRQPDQIRVFLHRTSILERLCAPLCDALIQGIDSRKTLRHIEQANLFLVPLDDERRWYRYHQLFRDFLLSCLREQEPNFIPELHLRASQWFETEGFTHEAIYHALAREDYARTARLILQIAPTLLLYQHNRTIINWVEQLPEDILHSQPELIVIYAWALLSLNIRHDELNRLLEIAEANQHLAPESDVAAWICILRAFMANMQEEYSRALNLLEQASHQLEAKSHDKYPQAHGVIAYCRCCAYYFSGDLDSADQYFPTAIRLNQEAATPAAVIASIAHWGNVKIAKGELRQLREIYSKGEQLLKRFEQGSELQGRRMLAPNFFVQASSLFYEWNELEIAEKYLAQALELFQLGGTPYEKIEGYLALARLNQGKGDISEALSLMKQIDDLWAERPDAPRLTRTVLGTQIMGLRLLLYQKHPQLRKLLFDVACWVQSRRLKASDNFSYDHEPEYLVLAQLRVAQDEAEEAQPTLDRLVRAAETSGRMGDLIRYLNASAICLAAQGQTEAALSALRRSLILAEPEGYIRTFVDQGPAMQKLLTLEADHGTTTEYLSQLLTAFEPETLPATGKAHTGGLIDPLTYRELEVLRLMDARLRDKEIAAELNLSVHTVKWYARIIYQKLCVKNRREAVIRAKELDIIAR